MFVETLAIIFAFTGYAGATEARPSSAHHLKSHRQPARKPASPRTLQGKRPPTGGAPSLKLAAVVPNATAGASADARDSSKVPHASAVPQNDRQPPGLTTASLNEIVVTARKITESILTVPMAITALPGPRLQSLQVHSLTDLAGYVPGLTVSGYGAPGANSIVLRGLADGYVTDDAGPLVATYIDDVPVGSSTATARGNLFGLDLVPFDLERVEVLSGPQGTLYGADAMGGLIKYVLKQPSLTSFGADLGTQVGKVDGSSGADWSVQGALDLPIVTDSLGLRVSAFDKTVAGYIDNIGIGVKDSNHSTEAGGRARLLWSVNDKLSITATYLMQDVHADDLTAVTLDGSTLQPLYGPQILNTAFPQPLEQTTRLYSLSINWELGFATLHSVAGWSELNTAISEDFTNPYAALAGFPGDLSLYQISDHASKFVEETRLSSSATGPLHWLVGGFFTSEHASETDNWPLFTADYVPLPQSDNLFYGTTSSDLKEAAGFASLTYDVSRLFDVSAGGRYSRYTQDGCSGANGLFGTGGVITCVEPGNKGVTTWTADAKLHMNQDSMLYFRVATGYRPGALNVVTDVTVPLASNPDRTTNYEFGTKGSFLDHRIQLSADVFHIDWRDIQISTSTLAGLTYITNGGSAVSNGLEAFGSAQVTPDLQMTAALAFTDAHLTEDTPAAAGGVAGDQLPLSARWTASLTASYRKPISDDAALLLGASYRYRDRIVSQFPGTPAGGPAANPAAPINPWNIVDLYGGVQLRKVMIRLSVVNVGNDRSYTGVQFINDPTMPRYVPIQPRTVSLSVDYQFH